ncbi:MAG: helix-turn-helix transcriptional regulator [Clostridiaceae bacterium]|jgi:transcriptional regulator with XRE-family HTH domain|nr:helix-turn-helix transcriptional regulator [Clostridiaceae bacterium]
MNKLSSNIKFLRKQKGLSQKELADLLNVSRVTITRYENGTREPDITMIHKIAEVLETTAAELMKLDSSGSDNYENKLGYYDIYNFIQRYHDSLYSNLLVVLKEHITDYPMLGEMNYKREFEEGIKNAVDLILQELTIQLLEKIIHGTKSKIFNYIKNTISTYNEKAISESLQNAKDILYEESGEIIENVLLEYATINFIEEIKKQTPMEFYGPTIYPDIKKASDDLIYSITYNIQAILVSELYGSILFLLIQNYYLNLNEEGRARILNYISDLSDNQKYTKDNDNDK